MARRRKRAKPERLAVTQDELTGIIDRGRASSSSLSDPEWDKLHAAVDTLAWVQDELATNSRALARLRELFGIAPSEKSSVLPARRQQPNAAGTSGPGAANATGSASSGANDGTSTSDAPSTSETTADGRASGDEQRSPAPGHGRNGADAYRGADIQTVAHPTLKAGDPCPECAKQPLTPKQRRRGKLFRQPPSRIVCVIGRAPLHATVYERERLRCHLCGRTFTAPLPSDAPRQKHDASAAAMIGLLKYGSGLPYNRLARLEASLGIPLPASTQWDVALAAANKIAPAYTELVRQCAQGVRVYNDDTSMRVLALRKAIDQAQKDGTAETDRTGIFTSAVIGELDSGHRVAVFCTGRQHAGENLRDVIAQRESARPLPLHMCDGLKHNVPSELQAILANCIVHARRNFVELIDAFPDECWTVIDALALVYKHDAEARQLKLSADARLAYHKERSRPVMDQLKVWLDAQIDDKIVEPNGTLGIAIAYMTTRWEKLTRFLSVPGAPLDNSLCERALKKIILHRKNSLFFKTLNGARVGDRYFSLIHTAELNGVNPFDYLVALIAHPRLVREAPTKWLPWTFAATLAALDPSTAVADPDSDSELET